MGFKQIPRPYKDGIPLADARKLVAEFGAANVATFDVTVDAAGRPRKVVVASAPPYPGMSEHVAHLAMGETYLPALHNCVPVAATARTALRFGKPVANAYSIVVPAYPKGWRADHPAACKVPTVQHSDVPAFPDSMHYMSVDARYTTAVRVHVTAAGSVTGATVVTPSGHAAFDNALLAAARRATYPLTATTGFKQVRPSGTSIAWNASHGSDTYVNCKPLPTDYVWSTTFARIVPIGVPGGNGIVLVQ